MFRDLIAGYNDATDLFDGTDAWILQDADGVVLAVEPDGAKLFGWDQAFVDGAVGSTVVHPDDRSAVQQQRHAARAGGGDRWAQYRVRSKNGRWLWIESRFRAVRNADGVEGCLTIASLRDVSAAHFDREVVELLAEFKDLIASARSTDEAWIAGLERVAQVADCSAAMVWKRNEHGAVVTQSWAADADAQGLVASRRETVCTDPTTALASAWKSGTATTSPIADVCTAQNHSTFGGYRSSLLIPVRSRSTTVGLVELIPTGETVTDDVFDLVVSVVSQLGEAVARKHLERRLATAEERLRLTFEAATIGMGLAGTDGSFIRANPALCEFLGRTEAELRTIGFQHVTHPDDLQRDLKHFNEMLDGTRNAYQVEKRYVHADGHSKWALLSSSLVRDSNQEPLHFLFQVHDIDARKTAEYESDRATAMFRAAFDDSGIGMALVHLDGAMKGSLIEANSAFEAITGTSTSAPGTRMLSHVLATTDADRISGHLDSISNADATTQHDELRITRTDGTNGWIRLVAAPVQDTGARARLAVIQIEDITDQRLAQERIAHIAVHDALTGLPNRLLITDRIQTAQQRSERTMNHVGVLFVDLDKFKGINDSFGHDAGDQLLCEIAERFRSTLRPSDTASRIGGDEFVVLCDDLAPDEAAATIELERVADRIHETLQAPINVCDTEVFVTASIGMNVVQGTTDEVRTTLSNADIAMYRAKARGRSRSEPYDAAIRREAVDRIRIGNDLRRAIERRELTVVYQPIIELATGTTCGSEALLRWNHPELGDIEPTRFIDIAEDSEVIVALGDFVVEQACRHLRALHKDTDFFVSLNASARQLNRADFVETMERSIRVHQLEPDQLCVELTENVLMDAAGSSLKQLNDLRDLGVGVGVDDFGTGYASLTYLRQLPVSFVKIDRSFIGGIESNPHDRTITEAVIGLAEALTLDVIAEGVETAEQARILAELGCAHAQGFHFGRPQPAPSPRRPDGVE